MPSNNPLWLPAMMDRVVRMMDRDKNFPCICIWSLGNESGYGPAHLAMAGYVRAKDPSRPVHYEGGGSRTAATDICCPMYARVHQIKVCSWTAMPAVFPSQTTVPGAHCALECLHALAVLPLRHGVSASPIHLSHNKLAAASLLAPGELGH